MSKIRFTRLEEAPSDPDEGAVILYTLEDGNMYMKDSEGTETQLNGGGSVPPIQISDLENGGASGLTIITDVNGDPEYVEFPQASNQDTARKALSSTIDGLGGWIPKVLYKCFTEVDLSTETSMTTVFGENFVSHNEAQPNSNTDIFLPPDALVEGQRYRIVLWVREGTSNETPLPAWEVLANDTSLEGGLFGASSGEFTIINFDIFVRSVGENGEFDVMWHQNGNSSTGGYGSESPSPIIIDTTSGLSFQVNALGVKIMFSEIIQYP